MWIQLTVIDETESQTTVPVNMDNVVTYTKLVKGQYPNANTVLYTTCQFLQTLTVTQTVDEIEALLEGQK